MRTTEAQSLTAARYPLNEGAEARMAHALARYCMERRHGFAGPPPDTVGFPRPSDEPSRSYAELDAGWALTEAEQRELREALQALKDAELELWQVRFEHGGISTQRASILLRIGELREQRTRRTGALARQPGASRGMSEPRSARTLYLSPDGKHLWLGDVELTYPKGPKPRRITPRSAEGRLLLGLASPGGVRPTVPLEARSHVNAALLGASADEVALEGTGDELRLSEPLALDPRLRAARRRL